MGSIDEALARRSDFDLCDEVFCLLAEKCGNTLDASLEAEPSRTITLVWHSLGIIGNEGFSGLFSGDFDGDPGYRLTVSSFDRIGARSSASAIRRAISVISPEALAGDPTARSEVYDQSDYEIRHAAEEDFVNSQDEAVEKLAVFIRVNSDEIRRLLTGDS